MKTVDEIIMEIKELPPEKQQQVISAFVSTLDDDDSYEIQEDDSDIGLEEDVAEAKKAYEEWKRTGVSYSLEDVCKELGIE